MADDPVDPLWTLRHGVKVLREYPCKDLNDFFQAGYLIETGARYALSVVGPVQEIRDAVALYNERIPRAEELFGAMIPPMVIPELETRDEFIIRRSIEGAIAKTIESEIKMRSDWRTIGERQIQAIIDKWRKQRSQAQ